MDILIRGGEAETAAQEMRAALRELFETEPMQAAAGDARVRGTRVLEVVTIILTVPAAIIASVDLIQRGRLDHRMRRLIGQAKETRKTTGATLLIDPGDGKPIPLEEAKRETILAALAVFEQRRKG